MKKIVLLLLIAPALVLGYLGYSHFFWGKVIQIHDVKKAETVTLESVNERPSGVRFHITGHLDGEATLRWYCSSVTSTTCEYEEKLAPGKIDILKGGDWYDQTYMLIYQPSDAVHSGQLQIRYSLG